MSPGRALHRGAHCAAAMPDRTRHSADAALPARQPSGTARFALAPADDTRQISPRDAAKPRAAKRRSDCWGCPACRCRSPPQGGAARQKTAHAPASRRPAKIPDGLPSARSRWKPQTLRPAAPDPQTDAERFYRGCGCKDHTPPPPKSDAGTFLAPASCKGFEIQGTRPAKARHAPPRGRP